ncbi:MAG: FtsX-like permease family protein [Pseudomonadota bacterium]
MSIFKIAARNIARNVRRSTMTVSAIALGAMATLVFGAFISEIFVQVETQNVVRTGHMAIYRAGFFKYGAGNPAAYGIPHYDEVLQLVKDDPVLKPLINVATPTVNLFGIAGNFDSDASKTFMGLGVIPRDYNRMHDWDEHHLGAMARQGYESLNENDEAHGFVGVGLGRILRLCGALKIDDCPNAAQPQDEASAAQAGAAPRDFGNLKEHAEGVAGKAAMPRLDLLAATSGGAPNVVSFYVDSAVAQGVKELDDAFIVMNFHLAQQLLYGRGEKKAVGIMLQLHRTEDIGVARQRIETILRDKGLALEVLELKELQPFYKQVIGMFSAIFSFIALVMVVIVLFTVVNTMSTSVMERTPEIGTLRAIGVKKGGITRQFISEGILLGVIGASLGLVLGLVLNQVINHSGLTWQPPASASPIPLLVRDSGMAPLALAIWIVLVVIAVVAAWLPARRGARLTIIDALGHV